MKKELQPYLVGVATIDVTPPDGSCLAGYAARLERSSGVYLPLRCIVTAIGETTGSTAVIVVSIEWLGFYDKTDRVRDLIAATTGIPNDHIILCGTHTHCGPPVRDNIDMDRHGTLDHEFLNTTFHAIARAAAEANASRRPAALRTTTAWCGFAHSRRKPDAHGGVEWMPTLDAPHDHGVPVAVFEDAEGKPLHILFSYACHPTSAGPILQVGGDYPGFAARRIEATFGCTAAFLLGCAGDQKPYIPDPQKPAFPMYPVEAVRTLGERLAASVSNAVRFGQHTPVNGRLQVRARKLTLRNEIQSRHVYESSLGSDIPFVRAWATRALAALDKPDLSFDALPFEIQILQFGRDLVLVAFAGEMSVEYGLRLVRELSHLHAFVWPVAYANEIVGYVPSARQYSEGGYEVLTNMQYLLRAGPLEKGSEDKIFEAIAEILKV